MTHLGSSTHVADTTPYAWPYDGDLTASATAVLVVQPSDLTGLAWEHSDVNDAAAEVAATVNAAGGVVVTLITAPPRGASAGSGAGALPSGSLAIRSAGIDGFYGSPLEHVLRAHHIQRLILVGYGTEISVHSTMRSANDRGYECLLVADACLAYEPTLTPASVSMIEMSGGIFGAVGTADAVIAAYQPRSTP